jgi:hypothetical protein
MRKNIGDLEGISEIPAISPAIEGKNLNTDCHDCVT